MRNEKQNGFQNDKPSAINSCTVPFDMVIHISLSFQKVDPGASFSLVPSLVWIVYRWLTVLVCPGLGNFLGCKISIAKTRKVAGKLGQVGYPLWHGFFLRLPFILTLGIIFTFSPMIYLSCWDFLWISVGFFFFFLVVIISLFMWHTLTTCFLSTGT